MIFLLKGHNSHNIDKIEFLSMIVSIAVKDFGLKYMDITNYENKLKDYFQSNYASYITSMIINGHKYNCLDVDIRDIGELTIKTFNSDHFHIINLHI